MKIAKQAALFSVGRSYDFPMTAVTAVDIFYEVGHFAKSPFDRFYAFTALDSNIGS